MAGADEGTQVAHTIVRVFQVLTLIPAWSIMAAIVAAYNDQNIKIPGGIICLFVTTLLASIWAFCILITTLRARNTALWIAFWDIVAMAILIAGVATTARMENTCATVPITTIVVNSDGQQVSSSSNNNGSDPVMSTAQECALLKAAWGLAIANIFFFFITALLAFLIYRKNEQFIEEVVEERHGPARVVREKIYTEPRPRRHHRHQHHRSHRPVERVVVERI